MPKKPQDLNVNSETFGPNPKHRRCLTFGAVASGLKGALDNRNRGCGGLEYFLNPETLQPA